MPVKYIVVSVAQIILTSAIFGQLPREYKGRPFNDSVYTKGAQVIPGRVELAYYDIGGEGIAYHDTDSLNDGSGKLNLDPNHQRPGVADYIVHFRKNEMVDISYTKDFADFNHPNRVDPKINQLYVGWEDDGEWTNYTVDVKAPGKYKIITVYAGGNNKSSLWLNNQKVLDLSLPNTGYYHWWDQATVGEIVFPVARLNLLTVKYAKGANLAYLDFVPVYEDSKK